MAEPAATRRPALLVTRNFPPLLGGMENVNLRLLEALAASGPALLCGPEGASAHAAAALEVREVPLRPLWRFVPLATWQAWRQSRRHRPALVIGGSGLAAPMAWLAARASGARFILYLHGLDLIVANRF